jgi:hypothetical protein
MLTRLQMPAGKAIALAAMPTALLMGMGLTPQFAQADPRPEDRFAPGPCVTRSDELVEDEDPQTVKPGATPKPLRTPAEPEPTAAATASAPEQTPAGPGDGPAAKEPGGGPAAEQIPPTAGSTDPLDPLGLGDAIGDLLGPGGQQDPAATPSASAAPKPSASASEAAGAARDEVKKAAGAVQGAAKDRTHAAQRAVPAPSAAASAPDAAEGPGEDLSGKEPFPCPTYDAEAVTGAEHETTSSLLPNEPWVLESTKLSLHGFDYQGIVAVRTYNGQVKDVLKFTASGVDIGDLHQLLEGPGGTTLHVEARKGSTSTIRNGTVTMYTEELKGNLFGLVPVIFSPTSPPLLNLTEVSFTEVTVRQAGQFGGTLHVPGMRSYGTHA